MKRNKALMFSDNAWATLFVWVIFLASLFAPLSSMAEDEIPIPKARPDAASNTQSAAPRDGADEIKSEEKTAESAEPKANPVGDTLSPAITPAENVIAAKAVVAMQACEKRLKDRGVEFSVEPSFAEDKCGVLRPIRVERLSSGVTVAGKTALWCPAAEALDHWVSDSVVPETKRFLTKRKLVSLGAVSTYVCRKRVSGSKISEHARGSAVDIGHFEFDDGMIPVKAQKEGSPEAQWQKAIRDGACGPFSTVLGPGTNGDHATHFHFDRAARKNGPYCR